MQEGRISEFKKHIAKFEGYLKKDGYFIDKDGWFLHLNVFVKHYGEIKPRHHVHHINGIKLGNRPKNLIQLHIDFHMLIHRLYGKSYKTLPKRKKLRSLLKK